MSDSTVLDSGQTARQSEQSRGLGNIAASAVAHAVVVAVTKVLNNYQYDPFSVSTEYWAAYPEAIRARSVDSDGTVILWYLDGGIVLGHSRWYADEQISSVFQGMGFPVYLKTDEKVPTNSRGIVPDWRNSLRCKPD